MVTLIVAALAPKPSRAAATIFSLTRDAMTLNASAQVLRDA